jgi:1-aminocyclopropane-1-carboxylate deaminase/D-cysteine desulfhydrase-like pyridoxal-dependent ACC family enzyme
MATALATLMALPAAPIELPRTPLLRMARLERALDPAAPRLFIKRDDLLPFALGGNKVRKMALLAAEAARAGADTLVTCGSAQSNHARVTAAVGAVLGWRVLLILSGDAPEVPSGNVALDRLFGAELRFVPAREDRERAMEEAAEAVRMAGGSPFVIPLGASTPLGACAIARGVGELSAAQVRPDEIVHASSSGGTQAGLIAGCALFGLRTRVHGVSADESATDLAANVSALLEGMATRLGSRLATLGGDKAVDVDDGQIGGGYGRPTAASIEAAELLARTEGVVLDPVYTAKAMAGLIQRVRDGRYDPRDTVVFWHTGGLPMGHE